MDYIPLLVVCAAVIAYLLLRSQKKKSPPPEVYVCNVCGEKDCICHKEEPH
jgi:hypothetical protein